jgi:hypothetical protein
MDICGGNCCSGSTARTQRRNRTGAWWRRHEVYNEGSAKSWLSRRNWEPEISRVVIGREVGVVRPLFEKSH